MERYRHPFARAVGSADDLETFLARHSPHGPPAGRQLPRGEPSALALDLALRLTVERPAVELLRRKPVRGLLTERRLAIAARRGWTAACKLFVSLGVSVDAEAVAGAAQRSRADTLETLLPLFQGGPEALSLRGVRGRRNALALLDCGVAVAPGDVLAVAGDKLAPSDTLLALLDALPAGAPVDPAVLATVRSEGVFAQVLQRLGAAAVVTHAALLWLVGSLRAQQPAVLQAALDRLQDREASLKDPALLELAVRAGDVPLAPLLDAGAAVSAGALAAAKEEQLAQLLPHVPPRSVTGAEEVRVAYGHQEVVTTLLEAVCWAGARSPGLVAAFVAIEGVEVPAAAALRQPELYAVLLPRAPERIDAARAERAFGRALKHAGGAAALVDAGCRPSDALLRRAAGGAATAPALQALLRSETRARIRRLALLDEASGSARLSAVVAAHLLPLTVSEVTRLAEDGALPGNVGGDAALLRRALVAARGSKSQVRALVREGATLTAEAYGCMVPADRAVGLPPEWPGLPFTGVVDVLQWWDVVAAFHGYGAPRAVFARWLSRVAPAHAGCGLLRGVSGLPVRAWREVVEYL